MKKIKFLSPMDEFKLANYNTIMPMNRDLQTARRRAKRAKGQVINRSENSTEYRNSEGQLIHEYSYSEKVIVEEQTLGE